MSSRLDPVLVIVVVVAALSSLVAAALLVHVQSLSSSYLGASSGLLPSSAALERVISSSEKPVAIMFESPSCPVCKRMHPFWARLEESGSAAASFYHIVFSRETAASFSRYGVEDTPTFIVFVGGRPVARHVGSFESGNVTQAMLNWVMFSAGLSAASSPEKLASSGLKVFNERCSACHGEIRGLDKSSLEEWLRSRENMPGDLLAERLSSAVSSNKTLSELYGGYDLLEASVSSMRRYLPDLTSYEVDRATYLLEYASAVLGGRKPPALFSYNQSQSVSQGGEYTPLGGPYRPSAPWLVPAAAFVAGLIAPLSACVLPLLAANVAAIASSGRRLSAPSCALCGAASFAGVLAIAALFAAAGRLVALAQSVLMPAVAAAVLAAGFVEVLRSQEHLVCPIPRGLGFARKSGMIGLCASYGFLAVQCNLPLVAGALLVVAGAGGLAASMLTASSFALGASIPVAALLYAMSRMGGRIADRILAHGLALERLGGAVLLASGGYLLLYALGLL